MKSSRMTRNTMLSSQHCLLYETHFERCLAVNLPMTKENTASLLANLLPAWHYFFNKLKSTVFFISKKPREIRVSYSSQVVMETSISTRCLLPRPPPIDSSRLEDLSWFIQPLCVVDEWASLNIKTLGATVGENPSNHPKQNCLANKTRPCNSFVSSSGVWSL